MKKIICILLCFFVFSNTITASAYNISARSAAVIDGYTGEVLYSLNCNKRMPMASTTKIMTALLLCEMVDDLSKTIVTTRDMVTVEGSSMGLQAGDTVSFKDLLYGMLLSSGNDAANTTAIAIAGSVSKFADLMNERADALGLKDTHFVTPSGLDADEHYTTAYELALITKEALSNQDFAKAAASKSARLYYGNPPYYRTLKNHNKLLKMYDDIVGVKTGFTKKSGRCLVSASNKDGKCVIAVTLNDGNDWQDHRNLLDLGLSLVKTQRFLPLRDKLTLDSADGAKILTDVPSTALNIAQKAKVTYQINLPQFLYPPIKKGDSVGTINYCCNGSIIRQLPIKAKQNAKLKHNNVYIFFQIFISMLSKI
ncbi:MAG: D-alanyl-D-alanine carboxypeptidase family protein [Clostridia bacterium]|nr:D-alanyl-D-alanine carboxypeptidase family protein [Clostridia bacterium]